jgi:hypothetical protein
MLTHERRDRVLWGSAGLLALVASAAGVLVPGLYTGVVPDALLPGTLGQDVMTLCASAALLALTAFGHAALRRDVVALGLVGYLAYVYGILAIERTDNELYLVYLAVFGIAVWSLVLAAASIRQAGPALAPWPRWVRNLCAAGALLQPIVFIPLWVAALLPLMAERRQLDSLYSVYILDLCFVMPAFLLAAVLVWRRRASGNLLAAVLFVLGSAVIGSLALSALVGPVFAVPVSATALVPPVVLTALFVALAVLALTWLRPAAAPPAAEVDEPLHIGA